MLQEGKEYRLKNFTLYKTSIGDRIVPQLGQLINGACSKINIVIRYFTTWISKQKRKNFEFGKTPN
jgi:hypothetical protein